MRKKKQTLSIEIDRSLTDNQLMEYCLNLKASGYDPSLLIAFYSLGKSWHIDKFTFLMQKLNTIETFK